MQQFENEKLKKQIKALEKKNKKLLRLAFFDTLTKAYNRTWFEQNITTLSKIFLVIIDLNKLKDINDQKGHQEGDKYILQTIKILRPFGKIVRYGGDEFIVICKNLKSYNKLIGLECPYFSKGGALPEEYNSISEAIALADKRLYLDKKKNGINK